MRYTIFSGCLGNITLCILKGEMYFKVLKIISFADKNNLKKEYVCLPCLKFSDPLPLFILFVLRQSNKLTCQKWNSIHVFQAIMLKMFCFHLILNSIQLWSHAEPMFAFIKHFLSIIFQMVFINSTGKRNIYNHAFKIDATDQSI